jgi:hypothetical protein
MIGAEMRAAVRRLITHDKWIIGFVGAHVAAGLLSAIIVRRLGRAPMPNHIVSWEMICCLPVFVSLGVLYGLAILVGIWGALGTSHWIVRMTGFVVGASCVGTLACFPVGRYRADLYWREVATVAGVAAGLWIARRAGFGVRRVDAAESDPGGMQLSIRQLMILTMIVGCLVVPTRWLPGMYPLFHIILGFVSPWTILGTKRPLLGFVALCVGSVAAWVVMFGTGAVYELPVRFARVATILIAEALLVALSLMFVRSHGFRLANRWLVSGTAME